MDRLKDATADHHRDAERRRLPAAMMRGSLPLPAYRAWLGQMFLIHRALWLALERSRSISDPIAIVVRDGGLHVVNLRADLCQLGVDCDRVVPAPAAARAVASIEAAAADEPIHLLGFNYVLEGSMNGNRYLARALAPAVGTSALAYLDPYGDAQRPTWQAYRERMNALALDEATTERLIAAASEMFGFVADLGDEILAAPANA
jgi:heme oxygenase